MKTCQLFRWYYIGDIHLEQNVANHYGTTMFAYDMIWCNENLS